MQGLTNLNFWEEVVYVLAANNDNNNDDNGDDDDDDNGDNVDSNDHGRTNDTGWILILVFSTRKKQEGEEIEKFSLPPTNKASWHATMLNCATMLNRDL